MFGKGKSKLQDMSGHVSRPAILKLTGKNEVIEIDHLPALLGRNRQEVDVYVFDSTISRVHCKIDYYQGRLTITDLGSTVGTVVNGTGLVPNTAYYLEEDSQLSLGRKKFTVHIDSSCLAAWENLQNYQMEEEQDTRKVSDTFVLIDEEAPDVGAMPMISQDDDMQVVILPEDSAETSDSAEANDPVGMSDPAETDEESSVIAAEKEIEAEEIEIIEPEIEEGSGEDEEDVEIDLYDFEIIEPDFEIIEADSEELTASESAAPDDDLETEKNDEAPVEAEELEVETAVEEKATSIRYQMRWINRPQEEEEDCFPVDDIPLLIGRSTKHADRAVKARGISRKHMLINCIDGRYYIQDLNSTNGVKLNGTKIPPNSNQEITEGDIIGLGEREYQVEKL